MENYDEKTYQLIKCITELCLKLKFDEEFNEYNNITAATTYSDELSEIYGPLTPNVELIDFILSIPLLNNIRQFTSDVLGIVPEFINYAEYVWPISYDLIPCNIFNWSKYDVNLINDT